MRFPAKYFRLIIKSQPQQLSEAADKSARGSERANSVLILPAMNLKNIPFKFSLNINRASFPMGGVHTGRNSAGAPLCIILSKVIDLFQSTVLCSENRSLGSHFLEPICAPNILERVPSFAMSCCLRVPIPCRIIKKMSSLPPRP